MSRVDVQRPSFIPEGTRPGGRQPLRKGPKRFAQFVASDFDLYFEGVRVVGRFGFCGTWTAGFEA